MKLIIASDSGSTINLDRVSLVEETLHRDRSQRIEIRLRSEMRRNF